MRLYYRITLFQAPGLGLRICEKLVQLKVIDRCQGAPQLCPASLAWGPPYGTASVPACAFRCDQPYTWILPQLGLRQGILYPLAHIALSIISGSLFLFYLAQSISLSVQNHRHGLGH